jgi:adenylate cyclase
MTYRRKLLILLLGLIVITNGVVALANFRRCNRMLETEVHRKARAVASTTAALIDPVMIEATRARADESRPSYRQLVTTLRTVRDANRRKDAWVDRIFTLVAAPQDPQVVEYGGDSEERFAYAHHPGDIYERHGEPARIGLDGIERLAQNLSGFQAGYETAFAPVRDAAGRIVAEMGVTLLPAPASVLHEVGPAMLVPAVVTVSLAIVLALFLARGVTRPLYALREAIEAIGKGDFTVRATATNTTVEFAAMTAAVNTMAAGLRERETIKRAFSGYISRQVMDLIVAKGEMPELKGERRRITVLFSDIRGFTTMSEGMRPEEVVELLTEFFDRMVEVTLRNQGTIDKFLGDGMMVIFGAPADDPYQEEHAVMAAVEMQRELARLSTSWQAEGRHAIRMGIGINSGSAVVGNIGSHEHMEYTAIGDTVNLAARLETATKDCDADIIVSEHTYDAVRPLFKWRQIEAMQVKGRADAVRSYAVEGVNEAYRHAPSPSR